MSKKGKTFFSDIIISIIIVTDNDSDVIKDILKQIAAVLDNNYQNFEILVVDNYSSDETLANIHSLYKKIPHVRIISLSKHYSPEIALTAGLDNCIGDYALLFNIHTDPPEIIPNFIEKLFSGFDIGIGRYEKEPQPKSILSKALINFISRLSSHKFYYDSSYLLALNRKAINSITQVRRKSRNFSYINTLIGFRKTIIEYRPVKASRGKIKEESFLETFFRVMDIVISNSFKPMRFLVVLGMLISLLFLSYVFFVAIMAIFFNKRLAPEGWISTSAILGTMFFILFSLLSLISEYLIRVLDESRNEPLYFIAGDMDKSVINSRKNKLNIV